MKRRKPALSWIYASLLTVGMGPNACAAGETGGWQKIAAVNGNGTTICNASGDLYSCFAFRCGKGRGLEFAFLFNVGDYGTSPTARIKIDGQRAGSIAFTAIDPKRELVSPYKPAHHKRLIERMERGTSLVFDIGYKHKFSLKNSKTELERTLAACRAEMGGELVVERVPQRQETKASRSSPDTLLHLTQEVIAGYRPTDVSYDYRIELGDELIAEVLAPPQFGDVDISSFPSAKAGFGTSRRFIASPEHRAAIQDFEDTRRRAQDRNRSISDQDVTRVRRRFDEVLAATKAQYGAEHPTVAFVLASISDFRLYLRAYVQKDPAADRVDMASLYEEGAAAMRRASIKSPRKADVLDHLTYFLGSFVREAKSENDPVAVCSDGIPIAEVREAHREIAALQYASAGPSHDVIARLLSVAACADTDRQKLDLMRLRVHVARQLGDPKEITAALADVAVTQYLAGDRQEAVGTFREAYRIAALTSTADPSWVEALSGTPGLHTDTETWRVLRDLGLDAELRFYVARRLEGMLASHGDWYLAGANPLQAAVQVYDFSEVLNASGLKELADQFYAFPWCSYKIDQEYANPSPVFCMSLYGEHRINAEDYDAAIAILNVALTAAERDGDRPNTAIVLSQLARAHDARGELDQGLDFARRALAMVKSDGLDPHQFRLEGLEQIVANAELEGGRRDKVAEKLAADLAEGAAAVCEKGEDPTRFPAVPAEILLTDQVIAEEFLASNAVQHFVDCFNAKRNALIGLTKPWDPNLLDTAVSDVLLVLGLRDDREQATEILDFLFDPGRTWLHLKSDRGTARCSSGQISAACAARATLARTRGTVRSATVCRSMLPPLAGSRWQGRAIG